MSMVPATTPEAIATVLHAASGRHALGARQRRVATSVSLAIGSALIAIFGFGAWAGEGGESALLASFAAIMTLAVTYDLMKAYRVVEISDTSIEHRMPLQALSWRLNASELKRIDVEFDQKTDRLLFETKTGATRRIDITRSISATLRA